MLQSLVLCAVFIIHQCSALSFPHIYTTGTHYEVGYDIGRTFKAQIQEFYIHHPLLHSKFLPWAETPYGENIIQGWITITQIQSQWITNEIEGIADGAEVTFLETFMLCYSMEIAALLGEKVESLEPVACSDVYINYPDTNQIVIGHNEDTLPMVKKLGYFVTAHVIERDDKGKIIFENKFTHFTYPGILSGNAFGFNSHGIVHTMNALYPADVITNKTGRYILTRFLLDAKNMDDIKSILHNEGYGAAYGFNLNVGLLPTEKNNLSAPEIWNLEVAPNPHQNHSMLDIMQIPSANAYFHVNKYRRIQIDENKSKIVSSIHRTNRILQYATPTAVKNIVDILGDTQDKDYPIYRTPRPSDPESTVATAFFDLHNRKVDIFKDNPSNSSYGPIITLALDMEN